MVKKVFAVLITVVLLQSSMCIAAESAHRNKDVSDKVIAEQHKILAENTKDKGFGPQSPRDIDAKGGNNSRIFAAAPHHTNMNLCNIHFHKNAEHKGGEFTKYAGNGDGHGYNTGYKYSGKLSESELKAFHIPGKNGGLSSGDTIEVHYVHSTIKGKPAPTLASCLSESIKNPQLRVETQVYVLVNDEKALDFVSLTKVEMKKGLFQAVNMPTDTGSPIEYAGSTTGPSYNEQGSPFQVTFSVRPKVAKVNIKTVAKWLESNEFKEDHGHGVRNLVINKDLLSEIQN